MARPSLPLKIPSSALCIEQKGWVDFEWAFASGHGRLPTSTCKGSWNSENTRRDIWVACPLALTSAVNCWVDEDRWFKPLFSVKASLSVAWWDAWVTQVVICTPIWLAHLVKAKVKSRHSNIQDVLNIWEVYDSEVQYMPIETFRSLQVHMKVTCFLFEKSGPLLLRLHFAMFAV